MFLLLFCFFVTRRRAACSLDASAAVPAALEGVTHSTALADVKVGGDDSLFSAVERIFITTNGYTNAEDLPASSNLTSHPSRQVRLLCSVPAAAARSTDLCTEALCGLVMFMLYL